MTLLKLNTLQLLLRLAPHLFSSYSLLPLTSDSLQLLSSFHQAYVYRACIQDRVFALPILPL
jgi:hypothetical protein